MNLLILRSLTILLALLAYDSGLASDISINVIVTDKGSELFSSWESNPPGGFTISPVINAKRGEFLSAVVLFKNCTPDQNGNCDSTLDITAYDPSGNIAVL